MRNLRSLMGSSTESSIASESFDREDFDFSDDEEQVEPTEDDGYNSAVNTSDPEDIIVDRRHPEPQPPPPPSIPLVLIDGEWVGDVDIVQRPRHEDRPHPYARNVSNGYDNGRNGHTLRNAFRYLDMMDGRGSYNGFEYNLMPRRITGVMVKQQTLFYFVQWIGDDSPRSYPLEAEVMSSRSPDLVIRFHEDVLLNPRAYSNL